MTCTHYVIRKGGKSGPCRLPASVWIGRKWKCKGHGTGKRKPAKG